MLKVCSRVCHAGATAPAFNSRFGPWAACTPAFHLLFLTTPPKQAVSAFLGFFCLRVSHRHLVVGKQSRSAVLQKSFRARARAKKKKKVPPSAAGLRLRRSPASRGSRSPLFPPRAGRRRRRRRLNNPARTRRAAKLKRGGGASRSCSCWESRFLFGLASASGRVRPCFNARRSAPRYPLARFQVLDGSFPAELENQRIFFSMLLIKVHNTAAGGCHQ